MPHHILHYDHPSPAHAAMVISQKNILLFLGTLFTTSTRPPPAPPPIPGRARCEPASPPPAQFAVGARLGYGAVLAASHALFHAAGQPTVLPPIQRPARYEPARPPPAQHAASAGVRDGAWFAASHAFFQAAGPPPIQGPARCEPARLPPAQHVAAPAWWWGPDVVQCGISVSRTS